MQQRKSDKSVLPKKVKLAYGGASKKWQGFFLIKMHKYDFSKDSIELGDNQELTGVKHKIRVLVR